MSKERENDSCELNAVEVELLTADEDENYHGLTLKCVLVYLVRLWQATAAQG